MVAFITCVTLIMTYVTHRACAAVTAGCWEGHMQLGGSTGGSEQVLRRAKSVAVRPVAGYQQRIVLGW